eukprot:1192015-Prorocentrum_minimum.AAC.3
MSLHSCNLPPRSDSGMQVCSNAGSLQRWTLSSGRAERRTVSSSSGETISSSTMSERADAPPQPADAPHLSSVRKTPTLLLLPCAHMYGVHHRRPTPPPTRRIASSRTDGSYFSCFLRSVPPDCRSQ